MKTIIERAAIAAILLALLFMSGCKMPIGFNPLQGSRNTLNSDIDSSRDTGGGDANETKTFTLNFGAGELSAILAALAGAGGLGSIASTRRRKRSETYLRAVAGVILNLDDAPRKRALADMKTRLTDRERRRLSKYLARLGLKA